MANKKWNELEQGAKRRRSNQGTRGSTQPAASNPNKNRKSTDTNRNNSRPAAAKPAPKAAPKAAPKQNKPSGVQKVQQKVTYFTNKNKPKQTTQQTSLNRLARQKGTAQVLTGKQTPLPPKRATRMGQTLNPMEQLKTDAKLGRENWISRATVPAKPLTAEQQKKKNQQTAKQSGFNARARKQTLSQWDRNLPGGPGFQVAQAKQRFDEAKARGDMDAAWKAHREAESIRNSYGYSGGITGNEHITAKLSQDERNRLNKAGEEALGRRKLQYESAKAMGDRDRMDRAHQAADVIRGAKGYQDNRLSAAETGKGWNYGPDGRRMWAGTTAQNKADAAPGLAALRSVGEGAAGGLLYAGQTASRATRDKFERENIDKWIADEANYNQAKSRLEFIQDYKRQFGVVPDGYNEMQAQIEYNNAVQARAQLARIQHDPDSLYYDETHANTMRELMRDRYSLPGRDGFESPVSMMLNDTPTAREETLGERLLRQAAEDQAKATEGMNGVERFVTNALISTGQSVPGMALGLIPGVGPALGLGVLGAQAGGSRAYDLRQQGVTAEDAYRAGFISGGIEVLTEKLPLENFAQIVKGKGGKSALRNVLEQAGLEGSEEAVSYVGNYIADVAQQNPDAHFSWLELLENAGMGAIGGAAFGVAGGILSPGHAVSPMGAQSEEIQEQARGAAAQVEAVQDAETQIRTVAAQKLREDAQAYNEMVKAGVWSDAEQEMVKASLDQRYAEIAGQGTAQASAAGQAPLTQVFEEGMQRNRGRAERAPAASVPTPLSVNEAPVSVNPVEQAEQMTAEALRATDAEMARRDAVAQLQAETPPITYERSGLPPTSFLGAAIDARREARARAEAEAQVRRNQEIAQQNRVAAETAPNAVPTSTQASPNVETRQQTFVPNATAKQENVPVSYQMEGLASTMGRNGSKALSVVSEQSPEIVSDFVRVYNSARQGGAIAGPTVLTKAQRFAAYSAGRNDRAIDMGWKMTPGVDWSNPAVQQMDKKALRMADGVAKALGVPLRVVGAGTAEIQTSGGQTSRGSIVGNEVFLWKDTKDPVAEIVGHEFTHRTKDLNLDGYQAFEDYVMSLPGKDEAIREVKALYASAGENLSDAMAREEVAANYAGMLYNDSAELQNFIRKNYENRSLLETILDFFRDLAAKLTGRQKAQADEAVRLLEEAVKGASKQLQQNERQGRQSDNNRSREGLAGEGEAIDPTSRMSLSSMGDAFGFTAVVDQDTGGVKYYRVNGRQVKRVTTRDVKQSKMYQLVDLARQNGTISAAEAEKQATYLRRLMNLVLKTNDSEMIYAFEGSMLWSAVKDNADKQYGMTIDFEAICKKTEQMVAAMSEAMTRKGRGLTLDEINELYGRVIEAGEPVPCPPCYVFTRWIGLGGLLDNIKSFQTEFADTEAGTAKARKRLDEIRGILSDEIADLRAEDDARVQKNLEAQARGEKKSKKDVTPKSDDDLTNQAKKARLAELDKAEGKLITKRNKALNKLQFDNLSEAERQKVQASIDAIDEEYNDLTNQMRTLRMYSWLKDVRLSDTYKEVPDSVLFNLRAGEEFASRFADTWAFRTGQGAYYGKAITPYTDMRTGEIIQGVHKSARDIKIGKANPFSGEFDARNLTKKQAEELDSARLKVRQQNMRGGVRMQSVSDFRYEYGLDYIQAFFELQSIGAAVQTYSKVVEFVPMVASTGGFVNMSLIPWGTGFRNGKLAYSSVTGMDAEAAFKLQKQWDTAGTILIGVSDEHIRAAMADNDIYFIIPYHLSGGREDVIRQMLTFLGEKAEKYTDYSNVQSEKFPSQQNSVLALRNKILTASKTFDPTRAEQALLDSNEFLRGLYDRKFNRPEDPLYMLPMMSEDTKHIYPYEYWDVNSTYKTADVNGQRYLQWCEDLGVVPKFSGDKDGNKDFRNDKGYWKLLIDRRMYGRDGSYNPLTPINATGLNLNQLDRERARQTFGEAMTAPADLRKTKEIVDKAFPETAGKRFSITPQTDADYMAAVERGDMETAQRMVDEAAKENRYTIKAYHGTDKFGFTKFLDDTSVDGSSFFFAADEDVAGSYLKTPGDNRQISTASQKECVRVLKQFAERHGYEFSGNSKEGYSLIANGEEIWDREALDLVREIVNDYEELIEEELQEYENTSRLPEILKVGYGGVYSTYLKINNPLVVDADGGSWDDSLTGETVDETFDGNTDAVAYAKANGYDGVIVKNVVDSGNAIGMFETTVYIAFDSSQVKSADPVTYDDDGNVIQLSERFNAEEPDIRYSIGTEGYDRARLMRENQQLKEKLDYWRGQVKKSDRTKADPKEVRKLANSLRTDYSTEMDAGEITQRLQAIYDGIGKDWTYDRAYEEAGKLARDMIEQATETEDYLYNENEPLRKFFKDTPLVITPEIRRAIPDYNEWRKAQFGKLRLQSGDQSNIDQVFQEAAAQWPEWFSEEVSANSLDQLERIAEVMGGIYSRDEVNPFGDDIAGPAGYLTTQIMDSFWDVPSIKKTFADRAEERLGREVTRRLAMKERYENALQKVREQRDRKLREQSEKYLTAKRKRSQQQKERELRAKIVRHCSRLSAKLKSGTDKQHVPEVMQRIVATALDSINLGSGFTLVYDENGKAKRVKDGSGETTKRTEAFEELRNFYQQIITADPDEALAGEMPEIISKIVVSEELPRMIDGIIGFRDTPIANLGKADLDKIWETVKAIETTISTYDKALGQARFETISEPAFAIRDYASPKKDRRNYVGGMKHVDRLLNVGMLKPIYFLYRFGDGGKMIWKMIEDAQGANIRYLDEIRAYQEEHFKPGLAKRLEKEKHTFNFDGQEIELTTAQLINLYNLRKSEETDGHILEGGFRPDQIVKGIRDVTPAAPWHFTAEQIGEMLDVVAGDAELVRIADAMMGGIKPQAAHGNAASMEVYGIKKYRKRNYWPIEVDKNQTQTDVKNEAVSKTVAGSGFAKARNPHANNAIILRSAFDVYDDHVVGMAKYAAWLGPIENLRRILNFRYKDEDNHMSGGVKEILEKIIGKDGPGYYKKLMDDLNAGIKATSDNPFQQFIGAYKAAAIAGNIRVVAQQPTSIMRALAEVDPQDFILGMAEARRGQWENEIKKYAPIAIWKDWGYFTADTGRQMRNIFWGDDNVLQTANNFIMNNRVFSPGAADAVTWTAIWNAVKRETKRTRKDLNPDAEEFMYAVRDRFNEVINLTQVVDGIPQRSQLMRSENDVTKMATSFMGEPTTTYNMASYALHNARTSTGAERGKAMRNLARTTMALASSIALVAAAQSLVDAMRDDDKDEKYWEKFFQALYGWEGETRKDRIKSAILNGNLGAGMNPLTYIPFIKDVVSKRQGYKVTRMDMDIISRVMDSYDAVVKAMSGEGKKTKKNAWINFIAECSRFLGVPVANIKRDILSGMSTVFQVTGNYRLQYELEKFLYNIEGTGNFSEFAKLAYLAKRDGDTEAYEAIRADLIANGPKSEADVDKKIAELEKKAVTDTEEYQTALAQKTDAYHTMLEASPQYQEMDEELQGKVQDKLDSYAQYQVLGQSMEVDGSDFEKVKVAEASGVPAVDWAVLTVLKGSRNNYEENGKTIKVQDQMIETIDQMGGTDEEKSARYRTLYDSDKNNPWVKK